MPNDEQDPNGLNPHEPGAKLDAGKIRAGLLMQFPRALGAIASIATYGAAKYTEGGWQSVENGVARYTDALGRHLLAHSRGEVADPESGFPHLWHALWNAAAVVELTEREIAHGEEAPAIPESRGTTHSQLQAMHVEAEAETNCCANCSHHMVRVGHGGPIYFCTHGEPAIGADGERYFRLVQPDNKCEDYQFGKGSA